MTMLLLVLMLVSAYLVARLDSNKARVIFWTSAIIEALILYFEG